MKTAALYLRVSTDKQTLENQRADLMRLAEARGWSAVVYEEVESATKKRPVLEKVMEDARRGQVNVVACVALDRLDRNMGACVSRVLELDALNVPVVTIREPWLSDSGPVRALLVSIFSWISQQERETLVARTKAGLERARRQGKKLGRPTARVPVDLLKKKRAAGVTWAALSKEFGVSEMTLRRKLAG